MRAPTAEIRRTVFAPGKKRPYQKGKPKDVVSFRPDEELDEFLKERTGYDPGPPPTRKIALGAYAHDACDFYMQVQKSLGDEWWELVKRAGVDQKELGQLAGEMLRAQLKKK